MNKTISRDYIIIGIDNKPLAFQSDGETIIYGSLKDAENDFTPSFGDKCIAQHSLAVMGRIERGNYDHYTRTRVKFTQQYNNGVIPYGEIVYLPSSVCDDWANDLIATEGVICIRLLQEPTDRHLLCQQEDMFSKPRLEGWLSRAKKKAFHERTRLYFSTNKPTADNGYFLDKQHSFCINEKEFSQLGEMDEPIPVILEVFKCE